MIRLLDAACPYCKVAPGEVCVSVLGNRVSPHPLRVEAARAINTAYVGGLMEAVNDVVSAYGALDADSYEELMRMPFGSLRPALDALVRAAGREVPQ